MTGWLVNGPLNILTSTWSSLWVVADPSGEQSFFTVMLIRFPATCFLPRSHELMMRSHELMMRSPKLMMRSPELMMRSHELMMRSHELMMCSHELMMRSHELMMHSHEMIMRSHELMMRSHELMMRSHEMIMRSHELMMRSHELMMHSHELMMRSHELMMRSHELMMPSHELMMHSHELMMRSHELMMRSYSVFLRCFEGPKRSLKFFQRSLKISLRSPKRNLKKNLRSHKLMMRSHELMMRSHELMMRSHELMMRSHELMMRSHELMMRSHELMMCFFLQLVDFREVVSRMLGLDVTCLAIPDYEIISRLEKLIRNHHIGSAAAATLDGSLGLMSPHFASGYTGFDSTDHSTIKHSRGRSGSSRRHHHHRPKSTSPCRYWPFPVGVSSDVVFIERSEVPWTPPPPVHLRQKYRQLASTALKMIVLACYYVTVAITSKTRTFSMRNVTFFVSFVNVVHKQILFYTNLLISALSGMVDKSTIHKSVYSRKAFCEICNGPDQVWPGRWGLLQPSCSG